MSEKTYEERLQELQLKEKELELKERELNIAIRENSLHKKKPIEINKEQAKEDAKVCASTSISALKGIGKLFLKFIAGCIGAFICCLIASFLETVLTHTVRPGPSIAIATIIGFMGGWKFMRIFTDKRKDNTEEMDTKPADIGEEKYTFSTEEKGNDSWLFPTNLSSEEVDEVCDNLKKLEKVDFATIVPDGNGENDVLYRRTMDLLKKATWQEKSAIFDKFPSVMHSMGY